MKTSTLFLIAVFSMSILVAYTSCSDESPETEQPTAPRPTPNPNPEPSPNPESNSSMMKVTIGSQSFTATLTSNETVTAFKRLLPMTISMSELNNNEKYYGLSQSLPSNASNPGTIQNGDLMLYGTNTFVLFYKTFATSYSYTRIGSIDNPSGLQNALGTGSVTVTFELQ